MVARVFSFCRFRQLRMRSCVSAIASSRVTVTLKIEFAGIRKVNRYDPLIPAKASPDVKLDAFVVHGRADISARTSLAAFSRLGRPRTPATTTV